MDGSDSGRTNDYDGGSSGGTPDAHTTNYCHQLVEGGQSDWRLPTSSELSTMMNNGATSSYMDFFAPGTAKNFWSSNSSGANAGIFNIQSNGLPATVNQPKNTAGGVTCVRP